MTATIDFPDSKAMSDDKERLLAELKDSVQEVKDVQAGRARPRLARDFLDAL